MSLYNMMYGATQAVFFILPMLGEKHPDQYPRFRDCFLNDPKHPENKGKIHVYTRVGGNNRGCGFGEEMLTEHPNFVTTYDDDFDPTYGMYVFNVPEEWQSDYDLLISGKGKEISQAYKDRLYTVFPKLKDAFDKMFNVKPTDNVKEDGTDGQSVD